MEGLHAGRSTPADQSPHLRRREAHGGLARRDLSDPDEPRRAAALPSGRVTVRVIDYRVDGGETVRLLTDLLDPEAGPAEELAVLYHERWEVESAYRQLKTYQWGKAEVLRSVSPELVRQEIWAHLTLHHCLNRIIMRLACGEGLDPDRISFVRVFKHTRRSVVLQAGRSARRLRQFTTRMAAKVVRKLDNGLRRLRAADRYTRRPVSQYIVRRKGQVRRGTRRVPEKVITLAPAILQ
nr:transposase [Streptomyces sp. NWU339]